VVGQAASRVEAKEQRRRAVQVSGSHPFRVQNMSILQSTAKSQSYDF
jgi:hypothetical protein